MLSKKNPSFGSNISVKDFSSTISGNDEYASQVYGYIAKLEPRFATEISQDDFMSAVKKKDASVAPSVESEYASEEKPTQSLSYKSKEELLADPNIKIAYDKGIITDDDFDQYQKDTAFQGAPELIADSPFKGAMGLLFNSPLSPTIATDVIAKTTKPERKNTIDLIENFSTPFDIDTEIEDLSKANPYVESSTGLISEIFEKGELLSMGINPNDMDGFLQESGAYELYKKRRESGVYDKGFLSYSRDEKLALETDKKRMIDEYIEDKASRSKLLKTRQYQKQTGIHPELQDQDIVAEIDVDLNAYDNFVKRNFPTLLAEKESLVKKATDKYSKKVLGQYGASEYLSDMASKALNGALGRVSNLASSTLDAFGLDSYAERERSAREQDEFRSAMTSNHYMSARGKAAKIGNTKYIVDENGEIYDTNVSERVTNILNDEAKKKILDAATEEEGYDFSLLGTSLEGASVLGDLVTQIAVQAAMTKGMNRAYALKASRNAAAISSGKRIAETFTFSKNVANAMIAQGTLGAIQGYESTLKAARAAGIKEEEALELAAIGSVDMAGLYAMTSVINTRTKQVESLIGTRDLTAKAVESYANLGREGFKKIFNKKAFEIAKEFAVEGAKELVQENIQQSAETYVVNPRLNAVAGENILKDTMSFDEFVNTSILSFVAGGLSGSAGKLSGMVSDKGGIDDLKAISILIKDYDKSKSIIQAYAKEGIISEESAERIIMDVEAFSNAQTLMPKDLTEDQIASIVPLVSKVVNLQEQKKNLDPIFHEDIDFQIEQQREKIKKTLDTTPAKEVAVESIIQTDDTFTHQTSSEAAIRAWANSGQVLGRNESLTDFDEKIPTTLTEKATRVGFNRQSPNFQRGSLYSGKVNDGVKFIVTTKGDNKFIPSREFMNVESFENSGGIGTLRPNARSLDNFDLYKVNENGTVIKQDWADYRTELGSRKEVRQETDFIEVQQDGEFLEVSNEDIFELEDGTIVRAATLSDGSKVYETSDGTKITSSRTIKSDDLNSQLDTEEYIESTFGPLKTEEPLDLFNQPEFMRRPQAKPQAQRVTVDGKNYDILPDGKVVNENGEEIKQYSTYMTKPTKKSEINPLWNPNKRQKGVSKYVKVDVPPREVTRVTPKYAQILAAATRTKTTADQKRERDENIARGEEMFGNVDNTSNVTWLVYSWLTGKTRKLNKQSVMNETGMSASETMWIAGKNKSITEKGDPTVDAAAEAILSSTSASNNLELSDVKDELINTIMSFSSFEQIKDAMAKMYTDAIEYQSEGQAIEESLTEEEKAFMESIQVEEEALAGMTDEEITDYYFDLYSKQYESIEQEQRDELAEQQQDQTPDTQEESVSEVPADTEEAIAEESSVVEPEKAVIETEEPADNEEVKTLEEEIEFYEIQTENLQEEIEIEKGNLKEDLAEVDKKIKEVRASNLSKDEKADRIEELKAEKQDLKDDNAGLIENYREDIKANNSEIRKLKRRLKNLTDKQSEKEVREGVDKMNDIHSGGIMFKATQDLSKASGTTQVATTTGSYVKVAEKASEGRDVGNVLDYGAGLGLGTDAMSNTLGKDVDSLEVNPERWRGSKPPTYTSSEQINKKYGTIVSLNVLNVVPKNIRDFIVLDIASRLSERGKAYISSRKFSGDVDGAKNYVAGPEEKSILVKRRVDGKIVDVYQKGFDGDELVKYVKELLGTDYEVQKDNSFGASGVVVTKNADTKIEVPQISSLEIKNALLSSTAVDPNDPVRRRDVKEAVKSIASALRSLVPDLSVYVFNTKEEFLAAAKAKGYKDAEGSEAFYAPGEEAIYINLDSADASTVVHEAFHAIFKNLFPLRSEIRAVTADMMASLRRVLPENLISKLDQFADLYNDPNKSEEFVVELAAFLSQNYTSFQPRPRSIISQWINKIGKLFGFQAFTDDDVLQILTSLSRKLSTGEVILEKDLGFILERAKESKKRTGVEANTLMASVYNGKDFGISDKTIREWAKENGYSIAEINKYIEDYDEEQKYRGQKEEGLYNPKGKSRMSNMLEYAYRYLLSGKGFLPKTAQVGLETLRGRIESNLKKARLLTRDLESAISSFNGNKEELIANVEKFMTGDRSVTLPDNVLRIASEMRAHIDFLSKAFIDTGLAKTDEAKATIMANLGSYMNRSYRVFDDKNWSPSEHVVNRAKAFLRASLADKAKRIADEEANDYDTVLERLVNKEISKIIDRDFESTYLKSGMEGAKKTSLLDKRLDIPEEIRALMGEYTDPVLRYYRTVNNISGLIESQKFLDKMKKKGLGVFFFTEPTGRYNAEIAAKGTKTLDPLGGLYTTKEIAEALRGVPEFQINEKILSKAMDAYLKSVGFVKYSKTILSIGTHAKNIVGNLMFMIANGYYDFNEWNNAFSVIKNDIAFGTDESAREKLREYIEAGIINQSVTLKEVKSLFDTSDDFEKYLVERHGENGRSSNYKRVLMGGKKAARGAAALYQAEDDFFKIVSYEMEKKRYSRGYFQKEFDQLTDAQKKQVLDKAAENTKNLLPNYSRIGRLRDIIARLPVATFISFEMEAWRTAWNTVDIAFKEIKDPSLREVGLKRLAGIASVRGLMMTAYGSLGMLGFKDDDDEEDELIKAARKFVPYWSENSNILVEEAEDGSFRYRNISASDPWGSIEEVFIAFLRGETPGEALSKSITQFVNPYLSDDILAGAILDIKNNRKGSSGATLWNENDSVDEVIGKAIMRLYQAAEPGTFASGRKIYGAYKKGDDVGEEVIGQMTGFKSHKVDVKEQMAYSALAIKRRADLSRKEYNSARYKLKAKEITKEEFDEIYRKVNETQKSIYLEASELYESGLKLGATRAQLIQAMKDVSIPTKVIGGIVRGQIPDMSR